MGGYISKAGGRGFFGAEFAVITGLRWALGRWYQSRTREIWSSFFKIAFFVLFCFFMENGEKKLRYNDVELISLHIGRF